MVSEQNHPEHPRQPERPCQPNQPQVRPNQQVLLIFHNSINHSNYCKRGSCIKCNRVQTMLAHYFDEMNGTCNCNRCQVWLCVLNYHASVCQIQDCNVCKRFVEFTETCFVINNGLSLAFCFYFSVFKFYIRLC